MLTAVALLAVLATPLPTPGPSFVLRSQLVDVPAAAVPLRVPPGFRITAWAEGLEMPREMAQLPGGDLLVVESRAGRVQRLADRDGDGRAETRTLWADGLTRPYGILVRAGWVYIANNDSIVRVRIEPDDAAGVREVLVPNLSYDGVALHPAGHWTRDILFSRDGRRMFVSVGSASNNDVGEPAGRAAILVYEAGGKPNLYATGLRNPVSMALRPGSSEMWVTVNERDRLGNDLVPDYVTSVRPGGFYGWPYYYLGGHPDPRWADTLPGSAPPPESVVVPDVLLPAHGAALGLTFYDAAYFPERYRGGLFVGLHGSWNRAPLAGYAVVFIPFRGDRPSGPPEDFVTGFIKDADTGAVYGRPVAPFVAADGSLLISDDGAGRIWRVTVTGDEKQ